MTTVLIAIIIFLQFIEYIIIADIILSWVSLTGVRINLRFIRNVLDPIYTFIRKFIPSKFGALDFTPLILIAAIMFVRGCIVIFFPEVNQVIVQYT